MAKFYEDLKHLLTEMEVFLVVSLKDTKMTSGVMGHRSRLLSLLEQLREDHTQLRFDDDRKLEYTIDGNKVIYKEKKEATNGGPPAPDFSRTEPNHAGFLKKIRKDKKPAILEMMMGASKKWCALLDGNLYTTEGKTSKKPPKEVIDISDCKARLWTDDQKKEKKENTSSFIVSNETNSKEHVFEASSTEEAREWIAAIGPHIEDDEVYTLDEQEQKPSKIDDDEDDDDNLYDVIDKPIRPPVEEVDRTVVAPELPLRNVVGTDNMTDTGSDEDTYDDVGPAAVDAPDPNDEIYDDVGPPPDEIYDDTAIPIANEVPIINSAVVVGDDTEDETYEDAESLKPDQSAPRPEPRNHMAPITSPRRPVQPLPAEPPQPQRPAPSQPHPQPAPTPQCLARSGPTINGDLPSDGPAAGVHPSKLYHCVWDCSADSQNELSFTRGDMVVVLNKQFDDRGWWVARLGKTVGLVPKEYLSRAYSLS